jgi:hypothetical protein
MEWVGRNFAGRECSVSFSEGAPRSNGVPRDLRFHISVDELDEGESPWNAIQGFTLREDALSISVTSSPQKLRLSATQTQATPPKGELKRFQYGVEVSFDSQDRVSRVLLDHNGRTTSCIIRYASLGL